MVSFERLLGRIESWFVIGRVRGKVDTLHISPKEGISAIASRLGGIQQNPDV